MKFLEAAYLQDIYVLPDALKAPLRNFARSIHAFAVTAGRKPFPHNNMLILGPAGSGKSLLATVLAQDIYKKVMQSSGKSGKSRPELVIQFREPSDLYSERTAKIIESAKRGGYAIVLDGFDSAEGDHFASLAEIKDFGVPVIIPMDESRKPWIQGFQGMRYLFPHKVEIPKLTAGHLARITIMHLNRENIQVTDRQREKIRRLFVVDATQASNKKGDPTYSTYAAVALANIIIGNVIQRVGKGLAGRKRPTILRDNELPDSTSLSLNPSPVESQEVDVMTAATAPADQPPRPAGEKTGQVVTFPGADIAKPA